MCISCLVDNNCSCIEARTIVEIEREKPLCQIALWPKMYDLIAQERNWGKGGEKINRTGERSNQQSSRNSDKLKQQQQQHSLFSQANWARLEMKPERNKFKVQAH